MSRGARASAKSRPVSEAPTHQARFWQASWTPYYTVAGGMVWTSLEVPVVDRMWNFQVVWGVGVNRITRRGPGMMLEFRNHHISNAGTRGQNLGVNAAMLVGGVHWVLR